MAVSLSGGCTCGTVRFSVSLDSYDAARTSLCHCLSCRRAFGVNYGLTSKVPVDGFEYETGTPKRFTQDNGVKREFCGNCGVFLCEYGEEAADKFRYVMWGAFDDPEKVNPKGEFFCKSRVGWMPEIPGIFHKQEIKQ